MTIILEEKDSSVITKYYLDYSNIEPHFRHLLQRRIERGNGISSSSTDSERFEYVQSPIPNLLPPTLQNQISNVLDSKLNDAIMKGLHNVGILLIWWFCIMSVIGISMRCYLCCNKVRSGVYHPRRLYDAFADGDWSSEDPLSSSDNEEEEDEEEQGIALNTRTTTRL